MSSAASQPSYRIAFAGASHDLSKAQYKGALFDIVSLLVFEKAANRVSYIFVSDEGELGPVSSSLYRHLKRRPCVGLAYKDLEGSAQSFRLLSLVTALAAVQFFATADEVIPHMFIGLDDGDVIACWERGSRTQIVLEDEELSARVSGLIPEAG